MQIKIPPIKEVIQLNETVASCLGLFPKAKVKGLALDTRQLDNNEAKREIHKMEEELSLAVTDPVRFGAKKLADAIMQ